MDAVVLVLSRVHGHHPRLMRLPVEGFKTGTEWSLGFRFASIRVYSRPICLASKIETADGRRCTRIKLFRLSHLCSSVVEKIVKRPMNTDKSLRFFIHVYLRSSAVNNANPLRLKSR
jgi:hypothetical protein